MFAIRAWESTGTTVVMGADVSGEVGTPREGTGAEGTEEGLRVLTMSEEMDLKRGVEDRHE